MRELFDFLKNRKNLVGLLILGILISGLLVGIRLIREQQIIKSRATEDSNLLIPRPGDICTYSACGAGVCSSSQKYAFCESPLGEGIREGCKEDSSCTVTTPVGTCQCTDGRWSGQGCGIEKEGELCESAYLTPSQPGTNATPSIYQAPARPAGQVCVPGSYERHCTGKCGGCAADAGEMEVKQCKADGTGYDSSFGECSTVCAGACSANPSLPPAGGVSRGTKDCKATFTPSELGINDPRVCDRLHQYTSNNCGQRCDTSNDCPKNTDQPQYINPDTSNWCYEFKDNDNDPNNNNRCLQLRYKGTGGEPSCVSGETGVGACSGNACVDCVLKNRTDILPYYGKNGWDTSCSNQAKITDNWCSIDATSCRNVKSTQCATQCNAVSGSPSSPTTGTIQGKVVNARGIGVSGVKVWIRDEAGTGTCGIPAACDNGKYKSVTTGPDGKFEGGVTIGTRGYWVRIPDQTSLGVDGANNIAIFTAKQATKSPFANTTSQSYETQPFGTTSHGCWNDCNFTVQLVPSFPTKVRVAGSAAGLLLAGVYEHEFSGQYTPSNPLIVDWTLGDSPGQAQIIYIQFGFGTGSSFQWDTQHTYHSEAVTYNPISSPSPSPSSSPSTQRMPGDADDNKCVNTDDYTIWKQEVRGGRNTKCANWTTENPPIVDTEDYGIWYRAWKVLSNRENCITPPAGRCLDQR